MAKRNQDKIKNFRGDKHAIRKAADAWMAGDTSTITRTSAKRPPEFHVTADKAVSKRAKNERVPKGKQPTADEIATTTPPAAKLTRSSPVTVQTPPATTTTVWVSQACDGESDVDELGDDDHEAVLGTFDDLEAGDSGDDGVQVVTPKGRRTTGLLQPAGAVDAVELTVQQYQSVIADYKERLSRAERQVRAISKSHLADKFMENEVRKYVKESLWKRCKFITCEETMEDCMTEVATQFAISPEKCDHWKSTYAHSVRDALNNRRNNTSQDLKKELAGKQVPMATMVVM
jgi:hypothetical protein